MGVSVLAVAWVPGFCQLVAHPLVGVGQKGVLLAVRGTRGPRVLEISIEANCSFVRRLRPLRRFWCGT